MVWWVMEEGAAGDDDTWAGAQEGIGHLPSPSVKEGFPPKLARLLVKDHEVLDAGVEMTVIRGEEAVGWKESGG